MGMAKVIKPAQLLDKDPAKLSHIMATVPLLILTSTCCILWGGAFNICMMRGYWIDGKFLMNHLCLLPGVLLLSFPRKVLNIPPLLLLGKHLSTWRSSLCLGGCDTHKEARGLFMRLWDIFETSVPVLTQEQDNQNKVNLNRSTKIQWARGVGHSSYYKPPSTIHPGNYMANTAMKLD